MVEPAFATVDNYFGSLFYMSSFFMEKAYPQWQISQTGSRQFNLTLLGNVFDATNEVFLSIKLGAGGKVGYVSIYQTPN
jgi:hypothetical protein